MSKLYEALQQYPERGQIGLTRGPGMPRRMIGSRQSMEALHQALESALPSLESRIVQFVASRKGEGTTTIVREFANALHIIFKASVLVVDANPNRGAIQAFASLEAKPLSDMLRTIESTDSERQRATGITSVIYDADIMDSPATQAILRGHFGYVLLDTPALGSTATAISFARHVDGVVIVVEAERTRWPVVENTIKAYEAAGAKVLGVVLNKRAFYIPRWVYRWL
jgi:Mrp family chromosome partitioning ATPase